MHFVLNTFSPRDSSPVVKRKSDACESAFQVRVITLILSSIVYLYRSGPLAEQERVHCSFVSHWIVYQSRTVRPSSFHIRRLVGSPRLLVTEDALHELPGILYRVFRGQMRVWQRYCGV